MSVPGSANGWNEGLSKKRIKMYREMGVSTKGGFIVVEGRTVLQAA